MSLEEFKTYWQDLNPEEPVDQVEMLTVFFYQEEFIKKEY